MGQGSLVLKAIEVNYRNRYAGFLTTIIVLLLLTGSLASAARAERLPDPLEAGWKGVSVCEQLFEDTTNRILRCTFPPGVGHERHYHVKNFGYAVSGGTVRITDETGTRELELATGSSFNSEGVSWHEVLNIGKTTLIYLIVETRNQPSPGPDA